MQVNDCQPHSFPARAALRAERSFQSGEREEGAQAR